jgi:hypothetical protein
MSHKKSRGTIGMGIVGRIGNLWLAHWLKAVLAAVEKKAIVDKKTHTNLCNLPCGYGLLASEKIPTCTHTCGNLYL